jgi:phosphatidate cytidylyltransferase
MLLNKEVIHRIVTGIILGAVSWFVYMQLPYYVVSTLLLFVLYYILIVEWRRLFPQRTPLFWLLTFLYLIPAFIFMILMNNHPIDRNFLFILIILISTFDTGAYVLGSMFGRHKIAASVSPGKSWEGFIGGYLCAAGGFAFLLWNNATPLEWGLILGFTLLVCCLGTMGDFFESWLKRRVQLKDSGTALPGHGGFLDRFDAIMFTVLCLYFFKDMLIKIFHVT